MTAASVPGRAGEVVPGLGWPGPARPAATTGLGWPDEVHALSGPPRDATAQKPTVQGSPSVSRETPTSAPRPGPPPGRPRVIVVANQKGGVGKTTTAVNLAAALSQAGRRVLLLDMDPQGNASTALSITHDPGTKGIYEALIDEEPLQTLLQESPDLPGLFVVAATEDLAGAEIELVALPDRESRLRVLVDAVTAESNRSSLRFDFVFIDCPPSLGLLTVNALVAAEEVLIPVQCEYYALEGLGQLLKTVDRVRAHLNPRLSVSTVLLTMYDARTRLAAEVAEDVRKHFTDAVLDTIVPRSVRISEAPSYGRTVLSYDPESVGAAAYRDAARELAARDTPHLVPTHQGGQA